MSKRFDDVLIISDMDGTLLPLGGKVSAENKAAIRNFCENGGHFAVATGRIPSATAPYLTGVDINAPSIFYNGAMLYDFGGQKILATEPLQKNAADTEFWYDFAKNILSNMPKACVEVYTAEGCFIVSPGENDDPRLAKEHYDSAHRDLESLKEQPWLKFFICDEHERLEKMRIAAEKMGAMERANSFYSERNYYEFVAQNVSKGSMLKKLRSLIGNDKLKIIAAGDYLNDNEMLREADIGVASANAHAETKKAADVVGCRVEEHLIKWILENVIK